MGAIAVFHSVLGVRAGVTDAARRLEAAGHEVLVVDQYNGRRFDEYEPAGAFVDGIGFPALIERAVGAVADLPDGFLVLGFSNGGGMAEAVALQRPVAGAVLVSGSLPLQMLGADRWPNAVPVQVHQTVGDPKRPDGWTESVLRSVAEAGADAELVQYPGRGHLFTDPSMPEEYDAATTERLWHRVLAFCAQHG